MRSSGRETLVKHTLPECPACGESFDNIGNHFARSTCGFPALVDEQHEVIQGLLLGGAVLHTRYANPSLVATTRYPGLALWTADQLGWLTSSVRRIPLDGGGRTFEVLTRSHPELERYTQWFGDGEMRPPTSSLRLSRRVARTWFAYSASVAWSNTHESRETQFSAKTEPRRTWVRELLERLGCDPTYRDPCWYVTRAETHDLFEWFGGPVPGVEFKWAASRDVYDELRERALTYADPDVKLDLYPPGVYAPVERTIPIWEPAKDLGQQFGDEECAAAILTVAEQLETPPADLSISAYEDVRRERAGLPSSSLIAERFGGWEAAKAAASSLDDETGVGWIDAAGRYRHGYTTTREGAKQAIREVAARIDEDDRLTVRRYDGCRDERHPTGTNISRKFSWPDLLDEVGLEAHERPDSQRFSDADLQEAIAAANQTADGRLRVDDYRAWRTEQVASGNDAPTYQTIRRRFGSWANALGAALYRG